MQARRSFWLSLVAWLGILFVAPAAAEPGLPVELLGDAELADVFFLDDQRGWAVGERGAIWHTQDAGRHWRLQPSSVTARLESVWFVDAERGWAVGGETRPYTHASQAVVLRTLNGGQTWNAVEGLTLPALRRVRFFDSRHGWAAGGSSSMYPTGVFRTSDAGRTWIPMTRGPARHWRCADFASPLGGAVAAVDGSLAVAQQYELLPARAPDSGLRRAASLRLDAAGNGWLAGEGGLVRTTADGGRSWRSPPGALPNTAPQCDLAAVAFVGSHVWLAGTPGALVFHSTDSGQTWRAEPTGQRLPIRAITFVDEQRGWAVGSMGKIMATVDGGKTWKAQRSGGERAALLALLLEPDEAPLELFAQLADGEGYLTAVELLGRRDVELPPDAGELLEYRAREALASVGVCSTAAAWGFPLRQPGLSVSVERVLDAWNSCHAGEGLARLEERLVARIRLWRPDVVLTESANSRGDRPLRQMFHRRVLAAVEKAANSEAYPRQLSAGGLQTWRVKKVFSLAGEGESTSIELVTAQLAPSLGRSLADHASSARGLLFARYRAEPEKIGLRLERTDGAAAGGRDVFSGVFLPPGGDARRPPYTAAAGNPAALQNLALRRRTVSRMLEYGAQSRHAGAAWLAQLDDLTRGLSPTAAGDVLFQLASRFDQSGRGELAAEVHQALLERHSEHHLADASLVWLLHYYASGEAAWRLQRRTTVSRGVATSQVDRPFDDADADEEPSSPQGAAPRGASFHFDQRQTSGGDMSSQSRAELALRWGKLLEGSRPSLYLEPAIRFPLSTAQRRAGLPAQAEQWLNQLSGAHRHDAWTACAEVEQWLLRPGNQLPPKEIVRCPTAKQKPRLDGRLDDTVWSNAPPLDLASPLGDDGAWPAAVLIAHDEEYLYVALSCRKAPGIDYPAAVGTRRYDADLRGQDRIDLLIDIDRDYASYYRLSIDHRGWTSESCLGDATWNPEAFIAATGDETTWTIEAAIPLEQLAPPDRGSPRTWAVGLQRIVPGVGFQSWTQPAAVTVRPEGFGLLTLQ